MYFKYVLCELPCIKLQEQTCVIHFQQSESVLNQQKRKQYKTVSDKDIFRD